MYVSYRQYLDSVSKDRGLKYVTKKFARVVHTYENVFLYMYKVCKHERNFAMKVCNVIANRCKGPDFCNKLLNESLVQIFVRVRTFVKVRFANWQVARLGCTSKLVKLNHRLQSRNVRLRR